MDVHPPHEAIYSWRQFLLHLLTITIGLLIALALEHWAGYIHERHLVHDAENQIRVEVESNSKQLSDHIEALQKQDEEFKGDVVTLRLYEAHHEGSGHHSVPVRFSGIGLDRTTWETARSTGALSYMSYEGAHDIASVYSIQDLFADVERQSLTDTTAAMGLLANLEDGDNPFGKWTQQQYETEIDRIGHVRAQLVLVNAAAKAALDEQQKYLKKHGGS